jgi:hypothetical protein
MSDANELLETVIEVAHWFEVDLNTVVVMNHRLTLEGISKSEDDEIAETRESLALEDRDLVDSQIRFQEQFYGELRRAANHLALVGLVTRFQHWIEGFAKQLGIQPHERGLTSQLKALNDKLGEEWVPVDFFKDLVTARDSVVHGDSKAEWPYDKSRRKVAQQYRNGSELEVTADQLKVAIAKAIEQVKWYDEKIHRSPLCRAGSQPTTDGVG